MVPNRATHHILCSASKWWQANLAKLIRVISRDVWQVLKSRAEMMQHSHVTESQKRWVFEHPRILKKRSSHHCTFRDHSAVMRDFVNIHF